MDFIQFMMGFAYKLIIYNVVNNFFSMMILGAPSKEFLEQPITSSDHPFLRANVQSIKAYRMNQKAIKGLY